MKKKLHLIARRPEDLPKKFWQENIPELADFEMIDVELKIDSLRPMWKDILHSSSGIVVERTASTEVLQVLSGVPRRIGEIQCIDVMFKDSKSNWWPECFFREALHTSIASVAANLDTSASAYLTGEGSLMRVSMSILVQLGYRKINLVLEQPEEFESLLDLFKRQYFDIEILFLRNTDLTLQKNDGTILINTVRIDEHLELKEDLTYLNFIFGAGLVVDTQGDQLTNPVLDEAEHVGLRVLRGHTLQAKADWMVLSRLVGPLKMPMEEYEKKWQDFVQAGTPAEKPAEGPVTKGGT